MAGIVYIFSRQMDAIVYILHNLPQERTTYHDKNTA